MIKLTALYGHPEEPEAFDLHYQQVHTPLALKLPGLRGYTIDKSASLTPEEKSPYYLIASLYWTNMQDFQVALQSVEGQTASTDIQNFATGGILLLIGEVEVVAPVSLS